MRICAKYILKQFAAYTIISLMIFTFMLLMDKVFTLVNLVINKGVSYHQVFSLLVLSLPTIFAITMPMAVLAGGVLTFGRMASDGEIIALRTSGNTLRPLVAPVIIAGFLIALIMIPFNYYLAPISQFAFRKKFLNIAFKDPSLRIEESTLINVPPYTFLCFEVDRKHKTLKEIILFRDASDNEPSVSITARSGVWHTTSNGEIILKLSNGTIKHQSESEPEKFSSMNFDTYTLSIKPPANRKEISKNIQSMTGKELKAEILRLKNKELPVHNLQTRYHLRGSLAGAVLVLLFTGIPLGVRAEKREKTIGIGISIGIIAVYYFLMVTGLKLAFNATIPPFLGAHFANIFIATIGIIMLYKSYYR